MPDKSTDRHFQDWSNHVLEELVKLNSKYESIREDYHDLSERFDVLNKIISGNGDPTTGLILKLDRLDQESKRRSSWTKAAIGASVTAIFGFVGMLIKSVMKP